MRFFLFLFFFVGCTDRSESNGKHTQELVPSLNNLDNTKYYYNDTLCHENLKDIDIKGIEIVKACHVFFGDSLSKSLLYKNMESQLPIEYNMQVDENYNVVYTKDGEFIKVRFFFPNRTRNNRLYPDSIFLLNGVLYLSEKEVKINNKGGLRDVMMEEFFYVLKIEKSMQDISVRHRLSSEIR